MMSGVQGKTRKVSTHSNMRGNVFSLFVCWYVSSEPEFESAWQTIPQTEDIYIKSLQQFVDKKKIRKAKLKIVVDCSYGPTGKITPLLIAAEMSK